MWRLEDVTNSLSKKMSFRSCSKRTLPGEGWEEYPKIVANGDMEDDASMVKWWRHHCVFVKAVLHSSCDILVYEIILFSETSPKNMTF